MWQPPTTFLTGLDSFVQLTLIRDSASVGTTDEVVGTVAARNGQDYDVYAMNHRASDGWRLTGPLASFVVEPFTFLSSSKVYHYRGDRAFLIVNDNILLLPFLYNGEEWSVERLAGLPQPGLPGMAHVAGFGELLTAYQLSFGDVSAFWMRGTTAFSNVAGGLGGAQGIPHLDAFCDQTAGEDVVFVIEGLQPNAAARLVLGFSRVDAPFSGGVLVPAEDVVLPLGANEDGIARIGFPWPATIPPGTPIWYQGIAIDATAPEGVSISNAISGKGL